MLKKRIVLRVKMELAFQQQRRHPMRVVSINAKRQVMKITPMVIRLRLNYLHGALSNEIRKFRLQRQVNLADNRQYKMGNCQYFSTLDQD
jgi:hypothetical protein